MDVVRLRLRVVALLVLGVQGRDAGHALPDVALHAGELGRDLLRHELAAEAGLRTFHYRV